VPAEVLDREVQMICGIGIDTTTISEMAGISEGLGEGGFARIFTPRELAASCDVPDSAEYLATRFAAKEAVFKAVAHLLEKRHFDLRVVETLNRDDGSPYVNASGHLRNILNQAGVSNLLISITTEGDFATAFVIAERSKCGMEVKHKNSFEENKR
jgi:phosphopantetheine--protein transferase-like protein